MTQRESQHTHFRLNQQTQQCYYYCALFFYSRVLKENFCNTTAESPCSLHSLTVKVWVCLANLIDSLSFAHTHTHTQQCSMCGKLARIEEREREERMQNQAKFTESNKATIFSLYKHRRKESTRALNYQGGRQRESESELTDWLIDQSKKKRDRIGKRTKTKKEGDKKGKG